jgi:cell division protein FtsA
MAKKTDKNLIIGLDVGTSKVAALVGEVAPDNSIEVIGIGVQPSRGLKKGVVVNIESTVQSIQRAMKPSSWRVARSARCSRASRARTCAR